MTPLTVDALVVLSFGGPEKPADVLEFLANVTRGRDVPAERLREVARQYDAFGGRSPINDQNRDLIAALNIELAERNLNLPVYFGNRNWHPYLTDTVAQMTADGIRRAAVFVTSAFGSYSGCRQYRQDMEEARRAVGPTAPELDKIRLYYNHPGFVTPLAERVEAALRDRPDAAMVFTAHSIPRSMAASCDYEAQLAEAASIIMDLAGLGDRAFDVVYQSRSGPPQVPWLEPDINDHLRSLADRGTSEVVVLPLGFVSDHMEVLFDLDTQAAATADELGLGFTRLPTVGTDPRFVSMIADLVVERFAPSATTRVALGSDGPWPDQCPEGHCLAPQRSV